MCVLVLSRRILVQVLATPKFARFGASLAIARSCLLPCGCNAQRFSRGAKQFMYGFNF